MDRGKTVAEKILSTKSGENAYAGEIVEAEIDYVMVNDVTGPIAFKEFETLDCIPFVEKIVLIPDHFVPNKDISSAEQAAEMRRFARKYMIKNYFEVGKGGVCHQVMIDEGFAAPGRLIVGADSHTCTYGGLGAFSTGIGSSEAAACFAEGQLWFKVPESFKIELEGSFSRMVSGKDLIIRLITDMGVDGATYKALEFAGHGVRSVPVNERLTIANMAIEAGGKAGIFPADEMTLDYLGDRIRGEYQMVSPDAGAEYEKEMSYDLSELDYMVAMPHSPGNGKPVEEMDVPIDQAYLGSCTNGRIEDLRTAAKLLKGRKVDSNVRMIVVPASTRVYEQAMREGLLQIFIDAGAFISGPTCGACLGGYMGILASGERCVSSTNRNFIGRMGHKDSEVYLASPSVVAASAIAGRIVTPEAIV
ncbi:MAG: 3-isopropylmalate dehydratase large subunit [Methanomassiliicoccales archaeon]|nr:3-isopropylmalate dehydratase large subunit [Methanomassiliicoccales archaeon]NYT14663.1 3-isopropylmalate dehydratase large subunit [Methanomassiliicoccales archaeon]